MLVVDVFRVRAVYGRRHQSALAAWRNLLDVGANIGLISLFASKIAGPGGHVLSFEPSPDVLALLRENTEGEKNIKVLPYGIGNADTLKSFAAQGTSSAASFVEDVTAINRRFLPDQPIEQVTVTMRKLDTLLDAALSPAPSLVKIDIEGFELEALKGADRLLSSIRPKLLIEIHPPQLICAAVARTNSSRGFASISITGRSSTETRTRSIRFLPFLSRDTAQNEPSQRRIVLTLRMAAVSQPRFEGAAR